ncbi:unnamed protein product, partial [Amoebophrya sp. A120]
KYWHGRLRYPVGQRLVDDETAQAQSSALPSVTGALFVAMEQLAWNADFEPLLSSSKMAAAENQQGGSVGATSSTSEMLKGTSLSWWAKTPTALIEYLHYRLSPVTGLLRRNPTGKPADEASLCFRRGFDEKRKAAPHFSRAGRGRDVRCARGLEVGATG